MKTEINIEEQHLNIYKEASLEIIKNNNDVLFDEDILSLLKNPPLDSMDIIRNKILSVARQKKIVVDTIKLKELIENYRMILSNNCDVLKDYRATKLNKCITNFIPKREFETIRINKSYFIDINKYIKKNLKKIIEETNKKSLLECLDNVFLDNTNNETKEYLKIEMTKFINKTYTKNLLESIDVEILVKDTTLINGLKEQGERYLFTKKNSHLLNNNEV